MLDPIILADDKIVISIQREKFVARIKNENPYNDRFIYRRVEGHSDLYALQLGVIRDHAMAFYFDCKKLIAME